MESPKRLIEVEQVIATHRHEWGKWPDTEDRDYSAFWGKKGPHRGTWYFHRGDTEIRVHFRLFPVYACYLDVRPDWKREELCYPEWFPCINNTIWPPTEVMLAQLARLRQMSRDGAQMILWEHCHQCHPPVAQHLPALFPLGRTIVFGDDCPGSSDVKTFPVCEYFSAVVHTMLIYDFRDGRYTADEYKKRGVARTYFFPSGMSAGLQAGLKDHGFEIAGKLAHLRQGTALPIDLLFVGFLTDPQSWRGRFLTELVRRRQDFAGLALRLHGIGMPDGVLEPRDPPHPQGMAYPMAPLFAQSRFGLNVPVSSICNCRLWDNFMTGTVQCLYDPWKELQHLGFSPWEHYLPFGNEDPVHSVDWLHDTLASYRPRKERLALIAKAAYDKASEVQGRMNWTTAFTKLYFDHLAPEVPS